MLEEPIVFWLPWPPTVNSYYKAVRSSIYLSAKGRKYKEAAEEYIMEQVPDVSLDDKLMVEVTLFPPDRRKRDLDNYMKATLDAVTNAKTWLDDDLIDQLFIYRGEPGHGKVKIEINNAGPVIPYDYKML